MCIALDRRKTSAWCALIFHLALHASKCDSKAKINMYLGGASAELSESLTEAKVCQPIDMIGAEVTLVTEIVEQASSLYFLSTRLQFLCLRVLALWQGLEGRYYDES